MKDIKIIVSHRTDQNSVLIDNPLFFPVRCGAVFDDKISDIPGDNTGDNISDKKSIYSELTVHYWAWKNIESDYYGLCHYRRHFNFSDKKLPVDLEGYIRLDCLSDKNIQQLGLDNEPHMREVIESYDMILTEPYNFKSLGYKNVYDQYLHSPKKDLDCMVDIIKEKYPDFLEATNQYLMNPTFYPCLMTIMKKEIYFDYCQWLFSILFEMENRIDWSNRSEDSFRAVAYVAERMLGIYYLYLKKQNKYKFKTLQRAIVNNAQKINILEPSNTINDIVVAYGATNALVPMLAVSIYSLMSSAISLNQYKIHIFHCDVDETNKSLLQNIIKECNNIQIYFHNFEICLSEYIVKPSIAHDSYHLFIPYLMKQYASVIYLSLGATVKEDIAVLFSETWNSGKMISAVKDVFVIGEYHRDLYNSKDYLKEKLQLKDPLNYCNMKVCVFHPNNFPEDYKKNMDSHFLEDFYNYCADDFLNKVCEGYINFIDYSWNVIAGDNDRLKIQAFYAPKGAYQMYCESKKHPKIIQYAPEELALLFPEQDMVSEFWLVARKTIVYESVLALMSRLTQRYFQVSKISLRVRIMNWLSNRLTLLKKPVKSIANKIFPPGTQRRQKFKSIYLKIRL